MSLSSTSTAFVHEGPAGAAAVTRYPRRQSDGEATLVLRR